MFKKILVCLDGSRLAEAILPYAIEHAMCFSSELVLFRAISESSAIGLAIPGMPGLPLETGGAGKHFIEDEQAAEDYLKSLTNNLETEGNLKVSYEEVVGVAGPSIVEYCEKNNIDLIAIATHGRSGPGRVVLGSVADYVIRNSGIPILLIRPTGKI
jgi:nucleotide-binding universal stress UspA family protein